MKKISTLFIFLISGLIMSQNEPSIITIEFVKIKNSNQKEALYFYENNWKKFRGAALTKGYIKSYRLLKGQKNLDAQYDLILATEYVSKDQFSKSEDNFQKVMSGNASGPNFLNDLKPVDFRERAYLIETKSNFEIDKTITEIKQIVDLNESFSKYYVNADYESLVNMYCEDGIILPPGADLIKGREEIKKRWILPEGVTIPYHEISPVEIQIIDDYAYDLGYYEGRTLKKDNSESEWKGKYLIIWKKEDGQWKIYADAWNQVN